MVRAFEASVKGGETAMLWLLLSVLFGAMRSQKYMPLLPAAISIAITSALQTGPNTWRAQIGLPPVGHDALIINAFLVIIMHYVAYGVGLGLNALFVKMRKPPEQGDR